MRWPWELERRTMAVVRAAVDRVACRLSRRAYLTGYNEGVASVRLRRRGYFVRGAAL